MEYYSNFIINQDSITRYFKKYYLLIKNKYFPWKLKLVHIFSIFLPQISVFKIKRSLERTATCSFSDTHTC